MLAALSVVGALIGADLVAKLGISANTSVVGALIAMLVGRIPVAGLRKMRSVHRQNLAQSAISAATFASANALLTSVAVPYVFGRKDLVWPMLAGAFIGLLIDTWVLYRAFGSRLLPADAAWPPGTAAAETIKAGDKGGKRALVLGAGTLVGLGGTLLNLPLSAAGVAFLGNVWALLMFGVGLGLREFSPDLFHTDLGAGYVPHGVMVGAGVVALGQAVRLLMRRRPSRTTAPIAPQVPAGPAADPTTAFTVDESTLRRTLLRGYALFTGGAVVLAVAGGLIGDMSPLGLVGWVLFAAFAALVHELIVGLAAMQSGWFPSFAVTLIFLVFGLLIGIPSVPLALLVGYVSATGPAFADMGYDLKAGWLLRRDHSPWDPYEREGRREQFRAALIGFAAALVVVAVLWQSYFRQGLIPPVAKVYADTVKHGLGDPGVLRTMLLWAIPGALIQLLGGPRRQMGVMLATGLLILTPNACWLVLAALAVRVVYRRIRGPRADEELNLVGAGLIAGSSLGDSAQIVKAG
ncbi:MULTISPECIES: OPT/YSL family transporter [Streptomyces]|uniref:OPT/YSL family transporter n=1 Tax=unclassified Streptomyces TaxID=2593676 RepID=UPI001D0BB931|nr:MULTISPECIES: OPT/YSL family transporter [Streptomyces]MCX5085967.1 OPT/YSL family transporter [Streptomyces sp. NBC_00401]UDM05249.1 OPT/YSL family transporter [Streptomyces longhuiensis]